MAYENLLIRERADLVDTKEEYQAEIKKADEWFQKTVETRKKNQENKGKGPGGIVADTPK